MAIVAFLLLTGFSFPTRQYNTRIAGTLQSSFLWFSACTACITRRTVSYETP